MPATSRISRPGQGRFRSTGMPGSVMSTIRVTRGRNCRQGRLSTTTADRDLI